MNNGDSEAMLRAAKRATLGAVGISLLTRIDDGKSTCGTSLGDRDLTG